jgi:branched-subunit amino acid aminotransferase/4-amino-4-deoxychorismate lyase
MNEETAPQDRALLLGDGIFETLLVTGGKIVFLEDHCRRLRESAAAMAMAVPEGLEATVEAYVASTGLTQGALRITLGRGEARRGLWPVEGAQTRLYLHGEAGFFPTTPARVLIVSERRLSASLLSRIKSVNYLSNILAHREAWEAGADEALFLNEHGTLTGGARANLFLIHEGQLFTPPISSGALPGITRGKVLELAQRTGIPCHEQTLPPAALGECDQPFLTNSLFGLRAIGQWRDRHYAAHPLFATLGEGYIRLIADETASRNSAITAKS